MAKVGLIIKKDKKGADGRCPVVVVIRHQGKQTKISTGVRVAYRDWNVSKHVVRKTHGADFGSLNLILANVVSACEAEIHNAMAIGNPIDPVRIRATVTRRDSAPVMSFSQFARGYVESLNERGKYNTFMSYQKVLNKVEAFHKSRTGSDTVAFADVTLEWVQAFMVWCEVVRGNGVNTVSKNAAVLHTFIRAATRSTARYIKMDDDPFIHITLPERVVKKDILTISDIRKIAALEDLPFAQDRARDVFLTALYGFGRRFGDVATMRWDELEKSETGWYTRYQMAKTGDVMALPVSGKAKAIFDKWRDYNLPGNLVFSLVDEEVITGDKKSRAAIQAINSANSAVNNLLAKVASKAGVKKFTMHIARHSAADHMLASGYTTREIGSTFGHASDKETEGYLRGFGRTGLEERLRDLF